MVDKSKDLKDKYYTPDISEFHVGFEYEYTHTSHRMVIMDLKENTHENIGKKVDIWDNKMYNGYNFNDVRKLIKDSRLRVKYLDKEDIESLGFGLVREHKGSYKFEKPGYAILYSKDKYCSINKVVEEYTDTSLFRGTIKNKSELIKLLKQLGINNNEENSNS